MGFFKSKREKDLEQMHDDLNKMFSLCKNTGRFYTGADKLVVQAMFFTKTLPGLTYLKQNRFSSVDTVLCAVYYIRNAVLSSPCSFDKEKVDAFMEDLMDHTMALISYYYGLTTDIVFQLLADRFTIYDTAFDETEGGFVEKMDSVLFEYSMILDHVMEEDRIVLVSERKLPVIVKDIFDMTAKEREIKSFFVEFCKFVDPSIDASQKAIMIPGTAPTTEKRNSQDTLVETDEKRDKPAENEKQLDSTTKIHTEIYCGKCGEKLAEGSAFCHKCGEKVQLHKEVTDAVSQKGMAPTDVKVDYRTKEPEARNVQTRPANVVAGDMQVKTQNSMEKTVSTEISGAKRAGIIVVILVVIAIAGWFTSSTEDNGYDNNTSDLVVNEVQLTPVSVSNGQMIVTPANTGYPEVIIHAPSDENCFVYFDNINNSANDFAFYVKKGSTVTVNAPAGTYHFYYATGETWYGKEDKFGYETGYYDSPDLMVLEENSTSYSILELTLYSVYNGNMDTDVIGASEFPI